jgi:hypothetical protein
VSENADRVANGPENAVTVPPEYRPRRRTDVLELDMGDGFILYNHDSSLVHHLNPTAALVWQLCDGNATVARLAEEIALEYGLTVENVLMQLVTLVAELDALGLLEDAGPAAAAD